jgi:1-acyl-sn-glycerol-3-phosphate acyltransferase
VFLIGFAGTLLCSIRLIRIASLFGQRPQEYAAGWLQWCLLYVFRLAGTRIVVERDPAMRDGVPYLIIANHQSLFDIPIFGGLLFRSYPKFISKRELAKWFPSISFHLRHGGHAVIDRGDREGATREIRALGARVLERGISAVIYPEGHARARRRARPVQALRRARAARRRAGGAGRGGLRSTSRGACCASG